jgi:undecaprenyl diphosphate synthase
VRVSADRYGSQYIASAPLCIVKCVDWCGEERRFVSDRASQGACALRRPERGCLPQSQMHVAITMEGTVRWSELHGMPVTAGYKAGVRALRNTVSAASSAGVATLTLYAPGETVAHPTDDGELPRCLLLGYLFTDTSHCIDRDIRINVIGRRERLGESLQRTIEQSERLTAAGSGMQLRLVLDYAGLDEIVASTWRQSDSRQSMDTSFQRLVDAADHTAAEAGAVDLLIRTRDAAPLSNFMLWESAYAKIHNSDCFWPDFDEHQFRAAIQRFTVP